MGRTADTLDTVLRYESCPCGAEFMLWRQDGRGWNATQQEAFRDAHSGCRPTTTSSDEPDDPTAKADYCCTPHAEMDA